MKKVLTVIVAVALAGAVFYGYKQHQRSELIASISPAVKNASIRVTNASKLETEKTNITFKELFDRLDADTAEIEKRSIDVQSIATKENAELTDPVVEYLRHCQEFSRAYSMKYRKAFAFSNALDRVTDAIDDARTSNSYGYEYAAKRRDKAMEEMKKASSEAKKADEDFVAATRQLKDSRVKLAALLPDDALVPLAQLDSLVEKKAKDGNKAEANKKSAKQ